jgi:hypothetical protein
MHPGLEDIGLLNTTGTSKCRYAGNVKILPTNQIKGTPAVTITGVQKI